MKPPKTVAVPLPLAEVEERLGNTASYAVEFELQQRRLGERLDGQDKKLWLKECELNAAYHDPRRAAERERIWAELCMVRQARTEIEQELYSSNDEDFEP